MTTIKITRNKARTQGKRTLVHFWWECKLAQQLWKSVLRFLKTLRIELLHDIIPGHISKGM
jgi:hypothetical protein